MEPLDTCKTSATSLYTKYLLGVFQGNKKPYTTVEIKCEKQGVKEMEKKSAARPPVKTFRSGNIQGAIWLNEREKDGQSFEFKTASLRKSWFDKEKNMWMNESVNLRRQDITKALIILTKMQEELFLNEEEDEDNE